MRDAWRLAVGTFTALPVEPPGRVDRAVLGRAMLLAPVTCAPAAVMWSAFGALSTTGWAPAAVVAVLALVVTALLSRALHLDGLADLADGLTSGHDPARSLQVMRRGDTGPAGAAALVLVLLLDAACLPSCSAVRPGRRWPSWPSWPAGSPAPCARGTAYLPRARRGSVKVSREPWPGPAWWGWSRPSERVAAVVDAWLSGALPGVSSWAAALAGLAVVLSAAAAAVVTRGQAVRRLGGVTGDVFGAAIEVALGAALVTAALAVTALLHP